jgi:serine/threonine protein phosphatase PrpC
MTYTHDTKDITVAKIKKDYFIIVVDGITIPMEKSEVRQFIEMLDNSIV